MPSVLKLTAMATAGGLLLSGCAVSTQHIREGYGAEVRADMVAQIADPDARYKGDPKPASNGDRAALAQTRYEKDTVKQPANTSTSSISVGGGNGGGGGGGGSQ
jgi:hypothetical protein